MSEHLHKYFIGELFKEPSDLNTETRPMFYTPDFSTCSRGIDAVQPANSVDLPTLPREKHQNKCDSFEVVDSTESTTHIMNTPSLSLKPNAMENQSDSASSKRSSAFLNSYFRENSNYHLDDANPPITFKNIQDYDTDSGERDGIWDTPTPRQQYVYLKKLRELEQEVKQIQQLQKDKSSTAAPGLLNIYPPELSSQRSVSESDIYNSVEFEDKMEGLDINNELNVIERDNQDMKKSTSIDNINKSTKRDRSSTIQHDQSDIRASPSFKNIKTKVTKLWGEKLNSIKTILTEHLKSFVVIKSSVLRSFTKLYPRGVAVSLDDGTLVVCMASEAVGYLMEGPSKNSCLMRFTGEIPDKAGKIVTKENHFGYPVKVTINMNGFLLVSDFGLRCLFVMDKGGNMLRKFFSLGGVPLWHVHALTRNPVSSFYVVQGGDGTLSITRLGVYLGTFEEISTSTKDERLVKHKVETASMNTEGQIVVASGNIITHVSLMYS